jgi:hypothetical protein
MQSVKTEREIKSSQNSEQLFCLKRCFVGKIALISIFRFEITGWDGSDVFSEKQRNMVDMKTEAAEEMCPFRASCGDNKL